MTAEQVKSDVLLAAQPTKEFVTVEEVAALARLPLPPTRRRRSPARCFPSTAAGPRRERRAKRRRAKEATPARIAARQRTGSRCRSRQVQDHQPRAAGRRRPWRLHLGRARRAARGRAARLRGDLRHQRRRHERRSARRRPDARRRHEGARQRLAAFWRRVSREGGGIGAPAKSCNRCSASGTVTELSRRSTSSSSSPRFVSPYRTNPLNINPLRDLVAHLVDFERVRATTA